MGVDSWGRGDFNKNLEMMTVVLWFHEWTRGLDHNYQRALLFRLLSLLYLLSKGASACVAGSGATHPSNVLTVLSRDECLIPMAGQEMQIRTNTLCSICFRWLVSWL